MAKECLSTNDKILANHPKILASEILSYNFSMFGFSSYGSHWRHGHKLVVLKLLSNYRVEKLRHVRESKMGASIKELYELCVKRNQSSSSSNPTGVSVEMKRWFGDVEGEDVLEGVDRKVLVEKLRHGGVVDSD